MRLIESFKKRKFVLFNIFLTLYVSINLVGGHGGKSGRLESLNETALDYSFILNILNQQ